MDNDKPNGPIINFNYNPSTGVFYYDRDRTEQYVKEMFVSIFGDDIKDTGPDSNIGTLIRFIAFCFETAAESSLYSINQNNIYTAEGYYLDRLGENKGLSRHKARRASVTAKVSGTPGKLIKRGLRAKTKAGDIFLSQEDFVFDDNGTAKVLFFAEEAKKLVVDIGDLRFIDDREPGVSSIINDEPGLSGADLENDSAFRARILKSAKLYSSTTPQSLKTYIFETSPETLDVFILNNRTNYPIKADLITVNPGTFWICVFGGTIENIAKAIFLKAGGTPTVGSIEATYSDGYTTPFKIWFDYAAKKPFDIIVKAENSINDTTEKIHDIFNSLKTGEIKDEKLLRIAVGLTPGNVLQFITKNLPGVLINSVSIGWLDNKDKEEKNLEKLEETLKKLVRLEIKEPFTSDDQKEVNKYTVLLILYYFAKYMFDNIKKSSDRFETTDVTAMEDMILAKITNYEAEKIIRDAYKKVWRKSRDTKGFSYKDGIELFKDLTTSVFNFSSDEVYGWIQKLEQNFESSNFIVVPINQVAYPDKIKVILT